MMRHQDIGSAISRRLQHHLVIWICMFGTLLRTDLDRVAGARKTGEEAVNNRQRQLMGETLFGPF